MLVICILAIILDPLNAVDIYDAEEEEPLPKRPLSDDLDFEPIVTLTKDQEKIMFIKNINCDDFPKYAMNCTYEAALIYNSSRKSPPMPAKIKNWCKAINHLTNCAIEWNADCRYVTENHFNEETIKGHMHVVNNVCNNEWYLTKYDELPTCIESSSDAWEACYSVFNLEVEGQKNTTQEWTHFKTHFYLCCARAQFRRCTLDHLFQKPTKCNYEQAVTLQKFSVIVSEGDVYQDCDHNVMYSNCPGGDPRPTGAMLSRLLNAEAFNGAVSITNNVLLLCITVFFDDLLFL